jgi:hypothetical protein
MVGDMRTTRMFLALRELILVTPSLNAAQSERGIALVIGNAARVRSGSRRLPNEIA